MARIKNQFDLNGTIGNLVFYQRNGNNYVRTKPARYRDAKSDSQLLVRGRFAGCNRYYTMIKNDIFRSVWKVAAEGTGKNAKNLFMQYNCYAFGKDSEISDYRRLHFSAGQLPLPDHLHIICRDGQDCRFEWVFNPEEPVGSPADRLYIVEIQSGPKIRFYETGVCRNECKTVFTSPDGIDESTHLYCFWGNEKGTSFSESHYLGEIPTKEPSGE